MADTKNAMCHKNAMSALSSAHGIRIECLCENPNDPNMHFRPSVDIIFPNTILYRTDVANLQCGMH